jgi:hypothetical protein
LGGGSLGRSGWFDGQIPCTAPGGCARGLVWLLPVP